MKKIIVVFMLMLAPILSFAQDKTAEETLDSLRNTLDSLGVDPGSSSAQALEWLTLDLRNATNGIKADNYNVSTPRYCLFPTTNMWTFIKLDTRNGRLWHVQYSVQGEDYRFETSLNMYPLVGVNDGVDGRFTLIPTQNTYNFILLDQYSGMAYQVQWSQEEENRAILPILTEGLD